MDNPLWPFSKPVNYHYNNQPVDRIMPHVHDGFEVFFVLDPRTDYFVENHLYPAKMGDFLITRADEIHHPLVAPLAMYQRAFVQFRPDTAAEIPGWENLLLPFLARPGGAGNLFSPSAHDHRMLEQIRARMHVASQRQDGFGPALLFAALIDLLTLIRSLYDHQPAEGVSSTLSPALAGIISFIRENLTGDLSLDALSATFFLDKSSLCRKFRKELGITVQDYIRNKRIMLAREQLSAGASVREACENAGFNDYANFIRTFTQLTGVSPGRYARRREDPLKTPSGT